MKKLAFIFILLFVFGMSYPTFAQTTETTSETEVAEGQITTKEQLEAGIKKEGEAVAGVKKVIAATMASGVLSGEEISAVCFKVAELGSVTVAAALAETGVPQAAIITGGIIAGVPIGLIAAGIQRGEAAKELAQEKEATSEEVASEETEAVVTGTEEIATEEADTTEIAQTEPILTGTEDTGLVFSDEVLIVNVPVMNPGGENRPPAISPVDP